MYRGQRSATFFGKRGRDYLSKLELEAAAQELLRQDLELPKTLTEEVRATEKWGCSKRPRAISASPRSPLP